MTQGAGPEYHRLPMAAQQTSTTPSSRSVSTGSTGQRSGQQQRRLPGPRLPSMLSTSNDTMAGMEFRSTSSSSMNAKQGRIDSPLRNATRLEASENDDYLHDLEDDRRKTSSWLSARGIVNVATLGILILGLLTLFAVYPILSHTLRQPASNLGAFNIGGTNGSGQVPNLSPNLLLKDPATPQSGQTWVNPTNQESYHLVFSDEFNEPGRTFWPGDDPFWEAVDLWYGATGDLEWYTPEQVNTTDGYLQITLEDKPMHNLNFRSGMLQSWNKFCFQGGYIEFSITLPGTENERGWWPGLWTMGNLARPGYLGSTDGMWPYSYSECDSGILPNQTAVGRTGYDTVATSTKYNKVGLSWLSGMRTPSCTCSGEDHPGPNNSVGRSAPEIDVLEAQIQGGVGEASQSLQTAPFDADYDWDQSLAQIYNADSTTFNSYTGGVYQEAVSSVSDIPARGYSGSDNTFVTYGLEYEPDWDKNGNGHLTWYVDGQQTWTASSDSIPPRPAIDIGQRLVPVEPMSIVMNLGISSGFQTIDFDTLTYPAVMKIDYVRVFQPNSYPQDLVSCDPADYPTTAYIERNNDVYTNPNLTTFPRAFSKNRITGC